MAATWKSALTFALVTLLSVTSLGEPDEKVDALKDSIQMSIQSLQQALSPDFVPTNQFFPYYELDSTGLFFVVKDFVRKIPGAASQLDRSVIYDIADQMVRNLKSPSEGVRTVSAYGLETLGDPKYRAAVQDALAFKDNSANHAFQRALETLSTVTTCEGLFR